jgi:hypothetical protein
MKMKQYEYKRIYRNPTDHELTELGNEGWLLVSAAWIDSCHVWVFVREF